MAFLGFSLFQIFVYFLVAYFAFSLARGFYLAFLHPLAKIPGPKLRAGFYFPSYWEVWTGDIVFNWHELHEKYGDIVRISPNWVSVIKAEAWRDVYGHANKSPLPKDPEIYFKPRPDVPSDIVSASDVDHARMRRLLNHAFSDQALRNQESIINSYITVLIQKLHTKAASNTPVDIMHWLNFTTFDIVGDLLFDGSFDALKEEKYNSWVANIFKSLKFVRMFRVFRAYPILGVPFFALFKIFPQISKARQKHDQYTRDKTQRRLDSKTERKDFMSYILKHNDERGMTREEIMKTSSIMIIAGSETSATLLSGAVFYLMKNPEWIKEIRRELQSAFKDESEMSFSALSQLKVLHAVIQETFRMYPPVPTTLPRLVTSEGATVAGTYLPPGTSIGVPQYPAYRSSRNFKDPNVFAPQRYLGDAHYQDDNRAVVQPFSVGPRNCIGQSLAWSEIRAILARLVWNFDMELQAESENWNDQKVFILWDKPSLMVRLKSRVA